MRASVWVNIAIPGPAAHRGSRRSARKGALTDSGEPRRENEALRERISALSAAILRISSSMIEAGGLLVWPGAASEEGGCGRGCFLLSILRAHCRRTSARATSRSLGGGRLSLRPSVEVGLWRDGGDAETGAVICSLGSPESVKSPPLADPARITVGRGGSTMRHAVSGHLAGIIDEFNENETEMFVQRTVRLMDRALRSSRCLWCGRQCRCRRSEGCGRERLRPVGAGTA